MLQGDMFPEKREDLLEKLYDAVAKKTIAQVELADVKKGYNETIKVLDLQVSNLLSRLGMTKKELAESQQKKKIK